MPFIRIRKVQAFRLKLSQPDAACAEQQGREREKSVEQRSAQTTVSSKVGRRCCCNSHIILPPSAAAFLPYPPFTSLLFLAFFFFSLRGNFRGFRACQISNSPLSTFDWLWIRRSSDSHLQVTFLF